MSDTRNPEIATLYGGVDSASQFSGAPVDAAYLRAIAVNANRLATKGHQALRLFFLCDDGAADGQTSGDLRLHAPPLWTPAARLHLPVRKMPGLSAYDVEMTLQIVHAGDVVNVQLVSGKKTFDPAAGAGDPNVLGIAGTGAINQLATLQGLPAMTGSVDELGVFIQGQPTARNGDTATYGAPNAGPIIRVEANAGVGFLWVDQNANTWNLAGNNSWSAGGHYFEILQGGNVVAGPFYILDQMDAVPGVALSPKLLAFVPAISPEQYRRYSTQGAGTMTYRIRELPRLRIFDIVFHLQDRAR